METSNGLCASLRKVAKYLHGCGYKDDAVDVEGAADTIDRLESERARLLGALEAIGVADQVPGHANYMSKAAMASCARHAQAGK